MYTANYYKYKVCSDPQTRNTVFLVDRLHWRGHMGCSNGYSLDGYTSLDVASINLQVNEQANAAKDQRTYCIHEALLEPQVCLYSVEPSS